MRKNGKKLTAIMMTLAMAVSMTACGNEPAESDNSTPTAAPTEAAEDEVPEKYRDLGGMEIIIADWWSTGEDTEPETAEEEATQAYRKMIQEKYNFTIVQKSIGQWGDHQETFTLSTMAQDPVAQIFVMDQQFVAKPLANNLFYDLSTLECFDFSESKWNSSVVELMTQGDHVYGMAVGKSEPRLGVFWNKRLFEEAGLDPDLPYDLQASGEWTWEKFEELCAKLTIDKDNDGTIDTYALSSFSVDMFKSIAVSNNAEFIGIDGNGKYFNATGTPEFLAAMQWGVSLIEKGYELPKPEDAEWNYFIAAFHDAKVAMTFAEEHKVGTWADMEDDWGFVMPPAGPSGQSMTVFSDNVIVMPACLDEETANKVAFAYNLYTNPTPGYEDEDDWMTSFYTKFRDARAVEETLALMYEEGRGVSWYLPLVYGTDYGDICYSIYGLYSTPAEKIEEIATTWQSLLDDANNK